MIQNNVNVFHLNSVVYLTVWNIKSMF